MSEHDHDHDERDHDDGGKWDLINFIPHAITAFIAVFGIAASIFWTVSDMKVRDMEMGTKISYLESRVDRLEEHMGKRASTTDADRQSLWDQVGEIKDALKNIEDQHRKGGLPHR